MMLLAWFASPASAGGKNTKGKKMANRAAVCTGACIDHSHDEAYSARWADEARSPEPGVHFKLTPSNNIRVSSVAGRRNYYSINDFTVYGTRSYRSGLSQHSPYEGEDAPSYDGHVKNEYRNMRANNTSEPLPSNDGQYSRR